MHWFVSLPFVPVVVTAVFIYGVTLPILQTATTLASVTPIVVVLWYLFAVGFYVVAFLFAREYFEQKMPVGASIWGFVNLLLSVVHVLASIGMSLWLMDQTAFIGIDPSSSPYAVYFTYFLTTSCEFIFQGGYQTAIPVNGSAVASVFGIFGGLNGVFFILFLFTLAARPVQRVLRKKINV